MAESRRRFLAKLNVIIGGAIGAVMAVPVLGYVLFPVKRRIVVTPDAAVPVANLDDIPRDRPIRVPLVVPEERDAWSAVRNVTLGSVWLRRTGDKEVLAFTATCPHLGCSVELAEDATAFHCPCHNSAFDLDGKHVDGPALRGMDQLDASIDGDKVLVKFARFKSNTAAKEKV
jgi:Rieske Fe-S protein